MRKVLIAGWRAAGFALAFALAACQGQQPSSGDPLEIAQKEHAAGKSKEAVIRLRNLIAEDGGHAEANLMLGRIMLELGDLATAESALLVADNHAATHSRARPLLLKAWLHGNQNSRILEMTELDAETEAGTDAAILAIRGQALLKEKQPAEARRLFDRLLARDPGFPPALLGSAQLAAGERRHLDAIALLDRALSRDARLFEGWFLKAELERQLGDLSASYRSYTRALDIVPQSAPVLAGIAAVEIGQKRYERARETLGRLRQHAPSNPAANFLDALSKFKQGDCKSAAEDAKNVLRAAPHYVPALVIGGLCAHEAGSYLEAAQYLRGAAERSGLPPPIVAFLASALLESNQVELAYDIALAGLETARDDRNLHAVAGDAALRLRRADEAIRHFSAALKATPKSAILRMKLGASFVAAGQYERAASEFSAARELQPGSDRAATEYVSSLIRKGEFKRASEALKKIAAQAPAGPILRNLEAAIALGENKPAEARRTLEQALQASPDFLPSAYNLMQLDVQQGDYASARKRLQAILARDPTNQRALLMLAELGMRFDAPAAEVFGPLEQAQKAHPTASAPLIMRAKYHVSRGEIEQAKRFATEARRAAPEDPKVYEALGAIQLDALDYANAVASFAKLIELRPGSPSAHYRLARAQLGSGNRASARLSLQKALTLKPDYVEAKAAIAALDIDDKNLTRALSLARELQAQFPKEPAGYLTEADVHITGGRAREAATFYRRAFQLAPTRNSALRLHDALLRDSRDEEADRNLREWIASHPKDLAARMYLAGSFMKRQRYREAAEQYDKVLDHMPGDALVMTNLAIALQHAGDPQALKVTEEALVRLPAQPLLLDNLASVLFANQQFQRSCELWERAVSLAPAAIEIHYRYAVCLARIGRKERAVAALRKVLDSPESFAQRKEAEALMQTLDPESADKIRRAS